MIVLAIMEFTGGLLIGWKLKELYAWLQQRTADRQKIEEQIRKGEVQQFRAKEILIKGQLVTEDMVRRKN